jgi:hypothetical protein
MREWISTSQENRLEMLEMTEFERPSRSTGAGTFDRDRALELARGGTG